MSWASAYWYSGLSCQSAPVTTSVSASPTFAASWPIATVAPAARRSRTASVSRRSEPVTAVPGIEEQPRDAAHAGSADAGEVQRAELGGQLHREVGFDHPINATRRVRVAPHGGESLAASTRSTMRSAPSRCPTVPIRAARSATRARSASSGSSTSAHPVGREVAVGDEQRSPGAHGVGSVERLLAVAHRVRDEDGRQPDRRQLAHGRGAGPRDGEIGGGEGEVHAVGVGEQVVAGKPGIGDALPQGAGKVQHLPSGADDRRRRREHGVVDPLRPRRAAGDEQHRTALVESERAASPRRGTRAGRGVSISRRSGNPTTRLPRRRVLANVTPDEAGEPGAEAVRQSRPGVRLVDGDGHLLAARSQVGGRRRVPAEAGHDIHAPVAQDAHAPRAPSRATGRGSAAGRRSGAAGTGGAGW